MKLLSKTVEERYQTAAGVESDLRRCLSEWETQGRVQDFPLGAQDTPDRLMIPEKLYGRDREVDTLLAAFDRIVAGGRPELVLVSGYSGIGKSSVVNELHKVARSSARLVRIRQVRPVQARHSLRHSGPSLSEPYPSTSEQERSRACANGAMLFAEALGPNGLLIVRTGSGIEAHHRRTAAGARVFRRRKRKDVSNWCFDDSSAYSHDPNIRLALFLDDLQWLDAATLDLLEDLLTQPDLQHLMLIGAYRDNEVDSAHPLMAQAGCDPPGGSGSARHRPAPL